jgi:nitric oxide reductase NorE protein
MSTIDRVDPVTDEPGRVTHLPGDINMWVLVLGDLVIFTVYFVVFMVYRSNDSELFVESQDHLNLVLGTINTIVLLTSSRCIALAVRAARAGEHRRAERLVLWTMGLAGLFAALKVLEWTLEINHGFSMTTNDFFMFYFIYTGIHLFHLLVGLVVLGVVLHKLREPGSCRPAVVETGATYWHMVDVVWVVLFALLYVLR